jgi:hypothetical protein
MPRMTAVYAICAVAVVACSGSRSIWPGTQADSGTSSEDAAATPDGAPGDPTLDADGVKMLFASDPNGTSWRLGAGNPHNPNFIVQGVPNTLDNPGPAMQMTEGPLTYWNAKAYLDSYSSNNEPFYTMRLHILASGGNQHYTWQDNPGYLSNDRDVKDQEFTIYFRIHNILDAGDYDVSMKIRGGMHTDTGDGNLGSCVLFTFGPEDAFSGKPARFGKELLHPRYDYISVDTLVEAGLRENTWTGLKMVSYSPAGQPDHVVNQLYLDSDPFDARGKPQNRWQLLAEYEDIDGVDSGRYSTVANWGGWLTSFRSDQSDNVDFLLPSVREILPAQSGIR